MPGKLLLIASDARLDELRALGDLPDTWLTSASAETLPGQIKVGTQWAIGCCPSMLFPEAISSSASPNDANTLDAGVPAEVLQNLLGVTVCYLAVVDGTRRSSPPAAGVASDAGEGQSPQDSRLVERDWSIQEHRTWYAKFRNELANCLGSRQVQTNHALVLICCTNPPAGQFDEIKQLTGGTGPDKLFDVCYVMMPELEPGKESGQFCSATHVWPVAVGGLLMKLQNDKFSQNAGPADTCAWRSYHLLPDMPQAKWENFCAKQFEEFAKRITAAGTGDREWESDRFTKFQPLIAGSPKFELAPQESDAATSMRWFDYSVAERLDEVSRGDRWEQRLVDAGDLLASNLSRQTLDEEPAAWVEVGKIWTAVHRNPRFVHTALHDRSLIEGPAVNEQFGEVTKHWAGILEQDRQRREQIEETRQCAAHLVAAQKGFIGLGCRLAVVAVVAVFIGYLSMQVFDLLLGRGRAMLIASAGALGALGAGIAFLDCERRAGQGGRETFERLLRGIDAKVEQRHYLCQEAVNRAHLFWQHTRARAAADRVKQLLHRVRAILDRELRFRSDSDAVFGPGENSNQPPDETPAAVRAKEHRTTYRQMTELRHPLDVDELTSGADAEEFNQFLDQQVMSFRNDLWVPFCEEFDQGNAGNFPARSLIPRIRGFAANFQAELLARVRRHAMQRLTTPDLEHWGDQIKSILSFQSYFELMSCGIPSHQSGSNRDRPLPRVYLRREFDSNPLMAVLDPSTVVPHAVSCDFLGGLLVVGFLFHEFPVQFEQGADSGVTVRPYFSE